MKYVVDGMLLWWSYVFKHTDIVACLQEAQGVQEQLQVSECLSFLLCFFLSQYQWTVYAILLSSLSLCSSTLLEYIQNLKQNLTEQNLLNTLVA